MRSLITHYRRWRRRPYVRPWALAVPVLVILVCAPLLRPLRYPDPNDISQDELARLLTVQSLVENRSMRIEPPLGREMTNLVRVGDDHYSAQPPVAATLLAGPYWVMMRCGLSFDDNPVIVPYLLTLIGVTLPVAAAAGFTYRMGRMFELRRPWRMLLSAATVFASGLVSYATVLNSHAPAAALVLGAAAALVHIYTNARRNTAVLWLTIAGLSAALAATIDPAAVIFLPLMGCVILAMRWPISTRVGGVLLYAIGATPPLLLHAVMTSHISGAILPSPFHPQLAAAPRVTPYVAIEDEIWQDDPDSSIWLTMGRYFGRAMNISFGEHGLLSHFPILIMGVIGMMMVMHRHWPSTTKVLAAASVAGGICIIVIYSLSKPNWQEAMFAVRWFIVAQPIVLFWGGAWLRRSHRPLPWALAGVLLLFSTITTLIGATGPMPPDGFTGYTAADAMDRLIFGSHYTGSPAVLASDVRHSNY